MLNFSTVWTANGKHYATAYRITCDESAYGIGDACDNVFYTSSDAWEAIPELARCQDCNENRYGVEEFYVDVTDIVHWISKAYRSAEIAFNGSGWDASRYPFGLCAEWAEYLEQHCDWQWDDFDTIAWDAPIPNREKFAEECDKFNEHLASL